jgi:hypothetical protein
VSIRDLFDQGQPDPAHPATAWGGPLSDAVDSHLDGHYPLPPARSGLWLGSPGVGAVNAGVGVNNLIAGPFLSPGFYADRVSVQVIGAGEAGALIRVGLYTPDAGGMPGQLLYSFGTVAADSTGGKQILLPEPAEIPAGLVYTATNGEVSGGCTVRACVHGFRLPMDSDLLVHNASGSGSTGAVRQDSGVSAGSLPSTFVSEYPRAYPIPSVVFRMV